MVFGLAIGLSVAFAIYMKDRRAPVAATAAPSSPPAVAVAESAPPPEPATEPEGEGEPRFSFYSMLPNFEVVIPEQEPDVSKDAAPVAIAAPGVYVLQAGSFSEFADADRRRAQLALLGVESRVQRVMIDERTYHRVRIGPTDDLDRLNRIRTALHDAGIDVLRIRLGD